MGVEATDILARIQGGQIDHLVFLVGSVVSATGNSACATVWDYRNKLIIEGLVHRLAGGDTIIETALHDFFAQLSNGSSGEFARAIEKLPFEQFMSCLDQVDPATAYGIVEIGCRTECVPFRPNPNHRAIVNLALTVLAGRQAQAVTILTTNYDLGLDQALKDIPGGTIKRVEEAPFPAYECTLSDGYRICYAKLHGCIRERSSLVYTFERLTDGMLRPDRMTVFLKTWLPVETRTLEFVLGYGFNDPDLRPVFEQLFPMERREVLRTERPAKQTCRDETKPLSLAPDRFYGADVLRDETLARLKVVTYPTDLLAATRSNLLLKIEGLATGREVPVEAPCVVFPIEQARTLVGPMLARLTLAQLTRFAASLAQACCRDDASRILDSYVKDPSLGPVDVTLADYYLEQFGHRHGIQEQEQASRAIRMLRVGMDVKLCGFAYESFGIFMGEHRGKKARTLLPLVPLTFGCLLAPFCSDQARHRFSHYENHYWLKLMQRVDQMMPSRYVHLYRTAIRGLVHHIVLKFNRVKRAAEYRNDARQAAETADLLAQALLLMEAHGLALIISEGAQRMASAQSAFHLALSCDRTTGWSLLAFGDTNHIARAIRVFARGMLRATYAHDYSWRPKLGINLIRAVLAYPNSPIDPENIQPKVSAIETLLQALGRVVKGTQFDYGAWCDIKLVIEHVLASLNNPAEAISEAKRCLDVGLRPVFVFNDDPPLNRASTSSSAK